MLWQLQHYRGHKQGLELLMKRGYKAALVDEHYTSKRCSSCKLLVSMCTPDKEWRKTKCNVCSVEHNMLGIVQAHARGKARPEYLGFPGYEQVLEPQKSPARKTVHEAASHDANRKRLRIMTTNQADVPPAPNTVPLE